MEASPTILRCWHYAMSGERREEAAAALEGQQGETRLRREGRRVEATAVGGAEGRSDAAAAAREEACRSRGKGGREVRKGEAGTLLA